MKTILHIGMPKTGTTALQTRLGAARAALAAEGLLYPANPPGCPFNNHRLLVFGFLGFEELPRHVLRHPQYRPETMAGQHRAFLDHVAAQVAAARPQALVLSSETLFRRLGAGAGARLAATVGAFGGAVRVAAYLRRPSDQYLSNLQQRLKQSADIGPVRPRAMAPALESYAAAFGRDAVAPRVYDRRRLEGGDILADFFAAHLPRFAAAAAPLAGGAPVNVSLSAEAMDLARRFRQAFHPGADDVPARDSTGLLTALRRAEAALGAPRPRLRPEVADRLDHHGRDPLLLRDRWGIVFPDLDYRRLERRRLAWPRPPWRPRELGEVVAIDPERRRALAAALAASSWARGDPARAAWVAGLAAAKAA